MSDIVPRPDEPRPDEPDRQQPVVPRDSRLDAHPGGRHDHWGDGIPGFEFGPPRRDIWNPPVFGASAVILGAAALFRAPLLLGPIAVLFGFIALLRRQYALGAIGTITGAAAILTSPWFWTGVGIAWLYERLF